MLNGAAQQIEATLAMFNQLNYATFLHMLNTQNVATDAMFTAQKVETVAMLFTIIIILKIDLLFY